MSFKRRTINLHENTFVVVWTPCKEGGHEKRFSSLLESCLTASKIRSASCRGQPTLLVRSDPSIAYGPDVAIPSLATPPRRPHVLDLLAIGCRSNVCLDVRLKRLRLQQLPTVFVIVHFISRCSGSSIVAPLNSTSLPKGSLNNPLTESGPFVRHCPWPRSFEK